MPFDWFFIPAVGSAGGILVGGRNDRFNITVRDKLKFCISLMLTDKSSNLIWRLVVVYGSPYEDGKADFIDELHQVMNSW